MAIYLNDFGVTCALGSSKKEVSRALSCSQETLTLDEQLHVQGKAVYVGKVHAPLPCLGEFEPHFRTRNNALAKIALDQLTESLTKLIEGVSSARIAVVIGTSTSGVAEGEKAMREKLSAGAFPSEFDYQSQELFGPAQFIAKAINATGPAYSISTACSSSSKAMISAKMLLESNMVDVVICGGVDSLCQLTINGFDALESISQGLCDPFAAERDGINIGEAAALFIMSRKASKVRLAGVGESSDAYHISAPEPSGSGAKVSMKAALNQAGVASQDIDYINLHGTGTRKNDDMEAIAVNEVFPNLPFASSTKRLTGHTLGAAGALEAGICWLLLEQQTLPLPQNKNNKALDPTLAPINLVNERQHHAPTYCLSNSFAFGGNNTSVILAKELEYESI